MATLYPPVEAQVKQWAKGLPRNSFMSLWVRYHWEASDMPIVYSLVTGLQVLEAISGDLRVKSMRTSRRTNIYSMLVGPAGLARKTFAIEQALDMITEVKSALGEAPSDACTIPYGLMVHPSTHQGAKKALQLDGGEFGQALIYYTEGQKYFTNVLKDPDLESFFMEAYDGGRLSDFTKTKESRVVLKDTRLSLLIGCTPSHINKHVLRDTWVSGWASRWVWALGYPERWRPPRLLSARGRALWDAARTAAIAAAERPLELSSPDPGAFVVVDRWYPIPGLSTDETDLLGRRDQLAINVGMLLAWSDGSPLTARYATYATGLVNFSIASARVLMEQAPNSPRDKDYRIMLAAIEDLAAIRVDTKGTLLDGVRVPEFSLRQIRLATARTNRLAPKYLEVLIEDAVDAGLVSWLQKGSTLGVTYKGRRRKTIVEQ